MSTFSDTNYKKSLKKAALAVSISFAAMSGAAIAQSDFSDPDMEPTNDLPNPYTTVEGYLKMPAGREWGSL